MNAIDQIIDWLRDAYAMECSMELILEKISKSDIQSSEYRAAAAIHLMETRQHSRIVRSLLKDLDADISSLKTGLGMAAGTIKHFSASLSRDERIKDLLTGYSMEQFEIACYEALFAAADVAGLPEVMNACQQILSDEEKMAENIREILPRVVQEYLGESMLEKAA